MKTTDFFLAQIEREADATRRVLEQVPEGHDDWKPHEKSMPLGYLATLVAGMPAWIAMIVFQDELDINPPSGDKPRPAELHTVKERLALLDDSLAKARAALTQTTDEHLLTPWRFLDGGVLKSANPREQMIADAVLCHLAHHRGQLTVYLRLNGAKVPAIYGPSADEGH